MHPRSRTEVERFFAGLEIVPPYEGAAAAVTHLGLWGAEDPELADSDGSHWWYGGVASGPDGAQAGQLIGLSTSASASRS